MLAGTSYVPLLRTKPAEINAFHSLSQAQKSATFPIFLSKPWQNANHFKKTIDKVTGAAGPISFGFGIDREHFGGDAKQPCQSEFDGLFSSDLGFRSYYECVSEIPNAVPLFVGGGSADDVFLQLGNADELGRGLIVRFTRTEVVPILSLAGTVPPLPDDTVFVVDAGWSRDPLQLQQWTVSTIQRIVSAIPDAEVVVMSSSFPDSFASIVGHGSVDLLEPGIFGTARATFNEAQIIYGDWATTRPPQSGGGGAIPPRIDIPMIGHCHVFRADQNAGQSYLDMASLAMAHEAFHGLPECYGRSLIEETLSGNGIKGTQRATEARINIHLTKHAAPNAQIGAEEDYID